MCDEPYVSPYLRRPVRSYDEILREETEKAGPRPSDRKPASPPDPAPGAGSRLGKDAAKRG